MKKIIFTKYSNDRADCFSIRTDIWQNEDKSRTVQKIPMHPQAKEHLENLCRWQKSLDAVYQECGMVMNRGNRLENGGVELEFIQGKTLEEKLDSLLASGQEEEAIQELKDFVDKVRRPADVPFVMTDGFRKVFGEAALLNHVEGLKSLQVTNIDLICANVILGEPMTVIDYEWCFDFPIPVSYVVYRILHYYICAKSSRAGLEGYQLFSWAGITPEEIQVYEKMEQSFQDYINGAHVPIPQMFTKFGKNILFLDEMAERERYRVSNNTLQVFHDKGEGFSQEESFYLLLDEQYYIETTLTISKDVKSLRLDPGTEPGICHLKKLYFICEDGREIPAKFSSNGHRLEADLIYFIQEDPQLLLREIPKGAEKLFAALQVHPADSFVMEKYLEKSREYTAAREKYRKRVRDMESTKVWRAYRAYRKLLERKK